MASKHVQPLTALPKIAKQGYTIHALAVMPDHVHLLMRWHKTQVDRIATQLKARATARLNEEGLHPLAKYPRSNGTLPSPWSRKYWCPFISSNEHMQAAIRYVENNPVKAGFMPQRWKLVTPYED